MQNRPMLRLWIRRVMLGLAGLILLAGATVTWLVASFDADRYRSLAIDWMRTERQRTLTIEGPVRLAVFPRLQVVLGRVQLSERFKPDPFLVLDEATLAVDLVPLLASQLVVHRIDARGARLNLLRAADGARNFDDLVGAGSGGGALKFELRRLALTDVRATVRDAMLPLRGEIHVRQLDTGRIEAGYRTPVELALRFELQEPALSGELDGGFSIGHDDPKAPWQLSGLTLRLRGDLPGLSGVDAKLRATALLDTDHDRLEAEELAIDFSGRTADWQLNGSSLRAARMTFDAPSDSLGWSELQLDLKGRHGDDRAFDASIRSPRIEIGPEGVAGQGLSGQLALEGAVPVGLRFETGAPGGPLEALRLPAVVADLSLGHGARRLEARVGTTLLWRGAGTERLSLERLELKGQFDPGLGGPPWPLVARGSVGLSPEGANWTLSGSLAEDNCSSEGSALPGGPDRPRPLLTVRARCERLDLGRWRESPTVDPGEAAGRTAAASASAAPPSPAVARRPAVPLDFAALRGIDARLSLRAGQFRLPPVEARDTRLEASLAEGLFKVGSLQARAWDGAIDASGQFDASQPPAAPALSLRLAATGVDVGALLRDLAGAGQVEGRGRFDATLNSTGSDLAAWRHGLQGEARLLVRDGAIRGLNLPQSLRQARGALAGEGRDATERARPEEKTGFSELRASFEIADGVARNRDLELKSPLLRIGGESVFDLRQQRLDIQARTSVASGGRGPEAADHAVLAGAVVPVQISGPFDAVDWTIRWRELAGGPPGTSLRERQAGELAARPDAPKPAAAGSADATP